jgi:hypothetical protein
MKGEKKPKNLQISGKELENLLMAGKLAEQGLSDAERAVLLKMDTEKAKEEQELGRRLTDEEAEIIEGGVKGGAAVINKLLDSLPIALHQVRNEDKNTRQQ